MIVLVMRKNQEVKGFVMQSTARKDTDNCTKFHIIHFNTNETHATVGIKEAQAGRERQERDQRTTEKVQVVSS